MLNFRSLEWAPNKSQRFQAEHNNPNSTVSHVKLAQDETLSLRERCKHALQAFEQRRRTSLVAASYLGVIILVYATFAIRRLMASATWPLTAVYVFGVICYSMMANCSLLNAYVARQIALRIRARLETNSEDLYLPSESLLRGQYMLLLRPPLFCEVKEQDSKDGACKQNAFTRVLFHRKWLDKANQDEPKPSSTELKLRIATDPTNTARERADAALIVFSKRFRHYLIGAVWLTTCAILTSGLFLLICVIYLAPGLLGPVKASAPASEFILMATVSFFCSYLSYRLSIGAWVAYHVKSRIRKSIPKTGPSELPTASDCSYYIPSDTLLCKGFSIVRTYPFYEEIAQPVQMSQVQHDAKAGEKDTKVAD